MNILSAVERDFNDSIISEITPVVWIEKLFIKKSTIHDSQKDLTVIFLIHIKYGFILMKLKSRMVRWPL